jgi:hypothetical protein
MWNASDLRQVPASELLLEAMVRVGKHGWLRRPEKQEP